MSRKFKLIIAYDGTHYSGWQIQPNAISIQELVEKAIGTFVRHPVRVVASGRTDAGVHARGQVAHFSTESDLDTFRFLLSVNGLLPRDIRVKEVCQVPENFHSQYSVEGKTYHYHLCLEKFQSPFSRLYTLHVRERLDLNLLQQAAQLFVGTHDFTSFANLDLSKPNLNAVRTIKRVDLCEEFGGVRLEFEGNGFLYKMVRNIVGVLLDAARGKKTNEEILKIFAARDRKQCGRAVPPQGLFLDHVDFPTSALEMSASE
ncbi:MAG: tRNA pseudouridine(38-40) synthase TruA [Parachlamydia sp.]|nr:MAG: tRNA pseudouridine(38-40) synthase TruA [Parachlamydia sp.]